MTAPTQKPHPLVSILIGIGVSLSLSSYRPASAQAPGEVARLIAELSDKSPEVRSNAAHALRDLGLQAKDATQDLVKAIQSDSDADVRQQLVWALRAVGASDKNTVPILIKAFEHDETRVRLSAAMALGEFGGTAAAAAPALARAMSERDALVSRSAANALRRIAEALGNKNQANALARGQLEAALKELNSHKVHLADSQTNENIKESIQRTVNHLEALERASFGSQVRGWIQAISFTDLKTWTVILFAAWVFVVLAVFLVKPLLLLQWNEALKGIVPNRRRNDLTPFSSGLLAHV
jgi:HEAT repeats/HEAT repeat